MKKLSNVSPFILLLVPVFIMMVLAFATTANINQNESVALKSTPSATTSMIKATTAILK
ncbi:MAG TPA: hypothetical protein VL088_12785 [Pedobacter sp.]|nr:hypothetical protein [Pedobacter sp.]